MSYVTQEQLRAAFSGAIQAGANANGDYLKFDNGVLICWCALSRVMSTLTSNLFGSTSGSMYRHDGTWTFPRPFIAAPKVISSGGSLASSPSFAWAEVITTTGCNTRLINNASGTTALWQAIAIGRWK